MCCRVEQRKRHKPIYNLLVDKREREKNMQNKDYPKLLECPFCGGKPFVSARLPYFGEPTTVAVVCEDCNASSKHKTKEEDAIKAWNTRTQKEG